MSCIAFGASAQIPTKCLEIESILVDACNPGTICSSSAEGLNEMVRFITGPQATALNDISVNWPNNSWLGLVQNAVTAATTVDLNATVESCGLILEPAGGIIPPGSTVILATSAFLCAAANPFTNLGDTIYIIYQDGNNTAGHFANSPAAGAVITPTPPAGMNLRTLTITYTPTNCTDTATYQRELLTNNLGSYGGQQGESDGGTVLFTWPGVPQATYINFGCQAPIQNTAVQVTSSGNLCSGGSVTLNATASGPFDSGFWSGGTGTFSSTTAATTIYTAGPGDNGNIVLQYCVVGLCANDTVCGAAFVPAGTGPIVAITTVGPATVCLGESIVLTGTGATTYLWSTGETTSSITVSSPGTYSVTGTSDCGSDMVSLNVGASNGPSVAITANGPLEMCPGESLVLSASGATSYLWSSGETTQSITIMFPGNYTVVGTSSCGSTQAFITIATSSGPTVQITSNGPNAICDNQQLTLTASGANTYLWGTGEITASIIISVPGIYSVTGTDGCGSDMDSLTITQATSVVALISGDTLICAGESTVLTGSGSTSLLWSTGETTPSITVQTAGTYYVIATGACGPDTAQVNVVVAPGPVVSIVGDTTLCPGTTTQLTASGADTYVWNTTETTVSISVDAVGMYSVTGSSSCGNTTVSVNVVAAQGPMVSVSGIQVICPGTSTVLTASGADGYVWSTGETTSSITVQNGGTYTVTGSNDCGQVSDSITVTEVLVNAGFTAGILIGQAPLTVPFTNTTDPATATVSWSFGDGSTSTESDPEHTYLSPGTYTVILTATDQGCTSFSSIQITVLPPFVGDSYLFVPNVFTPNGDAVNNVFQMQSVGITSLNMQIYNRWGEMVHEITNPAQVWDSRSKTGERVPDGTYFYVIAAKGVDGKVYDLHGTISVLR
ncbi:MAG: gliding motility-associated C-terminal domain-containing protein [Flavobacteriales bacterium]|nr:gliding motility-associated C-terminal domain-containing protein [Flavobacteriales bacterium]